MNQDTNPQLEIKGKLISIAQEAEYLWQTVSFTNSLEKELSKRRINPEKAFGL